MELKDGGVGRKRESSTLVARYHILRLPAEQLSFLIKIYLKLLWKALLSSHDRTWCFAADLNKKAFLFLIKGELNNQSSYRSFSAVHPSSHLSNTIGSNDFKMSSSLWYIFNFGNNKCCQKKHQYFLNYIMGWPQVRMPSGQPLRRRLSVWPLTPAVSFEMDLKTTVDSKWLPGASRVQRLLHQMNIWWNLECNKCKSIYCSHCRFICAKPAWG